MVDNGSGLYEAFKARDARFDGRFFVGISSTGIYCRPVCRARKPKKENCTFYSTAAEAEQAGYRPCLLCRPELAPGVSVSVTDASLTLARKAARLLEENCGNGQSLEELSAQLGCTDRHMRRVFSAEYNISPVQYVQTCRLLLAKNLLTDTGLQVLEIAMASGFGSLRRFNDVFRKHYRLSPTALRKRVPDEKGTDDTITVALGYRPPYAWERMLDFLAPRVIPGVEKIENREYLRTVRMMDAEDRQRYGWIRVGHKEKKNVLTVTVSETLLPVLPQVLGRIKHLFDLYCDPAIIYETLSRMNDIQAGLCVAGTRLPGCFDSYEMAVRAVLGQQISIKAASTLASRIVTAFGTPVDTGIAGLTYVFPSPEDILALDGRIENHLGPLGITAVRARTFHVLAEALVTKKIDFSFAAHPGEQMKKLCALPGIGPWTATYIAMRAMGWPDAFLETDIGVKHALAPRTTQEMLTMAETWRPWRSYATINLWNSLHSPP